LQCIAIRLFAKQATSSSLKTWWGWTGSGGQLWCWDGGRGSEESVWSRKSVQGREDERAQRETRAGEPASCRSCAGGAVPAGATRRHRLLLIHGILPLSAARLLATRHLPSPPTWRRCPRRRPPWRPSCRHRSGRAWRRGTWTAATRTSGCLTGAHSPRRSGQVGPARRRRQRAAAVLPAPSGGPLTLACCPALPTLSSRLSPNEPCPPEALHALGVRYWALDAGRYEAGDPQLAAIRKARGYSYEDCITITPGGVCAARGGRWRTV
jgi:hypothetical protein